MSSRKASRNRFRAPAAPLGGAVSVASPISDLVRAESTPRRDISQLGFHGTTIWNGLVQQDYNPDLRFPGSIPIYQRMRSSDPMVQTIENIISLPVRTVKWRVDPGDTSKAGRESTEFIQSNVLDGVGMRSSFDDLVRKALISVMIGFQNLVKWTAFDGPYVRLTNLLDVHPQALYKWSFDPSGEVNGIHLAGFDGAGKWHDGTAAEDFIPSDMLLRFSFREEWGNPEGFPLCRVMYAPWYIKRTLYLILNIGLEREWVNTPIGTYPRGTTKADIDNLLTALKRLATASNSAMVLEEGWSIGSYGGHAKTDAAMAYLAHLDDGIAKVALAQFVNLAGAGNGSRALSSDQSSFFLLCEQALASWICSVIQQQVIRQLVLWNWPGLPVESHPRLSHSHIATVLQPTALGHALAALVNKQLLTPDEDVENSVREMLYLPPIPEGQKRNTPPPSDTPPADKPPAARAGSSSISLGSAPCAVCGSAFQSATPLPSACPACESAADSPDLPVRSKLKPELARIRADLDATQADFIAQGTDILDRVIAWAEEQTGALADDAAKLPNLSRGTIQTRLTELTLPYRPEYQRWMRDLLMGAVEGGMEQLRNERGLPKLAISNELRSYVTAAAQVTVDKHYEDMRFAVVSQAQRDIGDRLGRDAVRFNTRQTLLDRANRSLATPFEDIMRAVTDEVAGSLTKP